MQEKLEQLLEQLSKLPAQQKWGGLALGVIALAGLHYYLVYDDQAMALDELRVTYQKLNLERSEKENYAQNMVQYEAKLNEKKRELDKARSQLPDDDETAQLLGELSNLGERIGLTIDRFEPRPETFHDFYAAIPFRTSVRGSFHDIAMFVDAIGNMDRIVNVSGITMQRPKVVSKKIMVEGEFMLTTFRFLKQGEAPKKGKGRRK